MHNMVTLNRTRIELTREVAAVEIPAGTEAISRMVHWCNSCTNWAAITLCAQ